MFIIGVALHLNPYYIQIVYVKINMNVKSKYG